MDILQAQLEAQKNGICCAMLTVVEAEGTSAFQIGKKMLLYEDGRAFGTIGGGSTEADALRDAVEAMKDRGILCKVAGNMPFLYLWNNRIKAF